MTITQDGINITKRFFEAIEILRLDKYIRGVQTFTRNHGINYWNMMTIRKEPDKHILKPEYILWLCDDYNISLEWIMNGNGMFYKSKHNHD
ncbi:MAG: hypothetical protein J5733_05710 [Bacteroidaceae bacterium]|nr:hypothetical protein [Bacteroidaceae bacterium]